MAVAELNEINEATVSLTMTLPKSLVDQIESRAHKWNDSLDHKIEDLLLKGIEADLTTEERFSRLSDMYRARLAREGKLDQTFDEVMEELARVREEIANELYPD